MRRFKMMSGLLAVALAAVALAVPSVASAVSTDLTAANVVPGPGDPGASGFAVFTLHPRQSEVCFDTGLTGLSEQFGLPAIVSYIHKAPVDASGPIVMTLYGPLTGSSFFVTDYCIQGVDRRLVGALGKHPSRYYMDVASTQYPLGAVRGQLHQ